MADEIKLDPKPLNTAVDVPADKLAIEQKISNDADVTAALVANGADPVLASREHLARTGALHRMLGKLKK